MDAYGRAEEESGGLTQVPSWVSTPVNHWERGADTTGKTD